ncbi:OmpP1/FadL family transporter [Methylomicrobium sp. RS1]|uniref:OmpP1/FadL family transporter n=1 Tax=Candidatus Methylomicrobium oryzae TaxID=2802053 RepID=UPI001923D93C|nr:outer membrane protein transport protein [Methylomicrobium sp. RS1]MBL1265833.1 outer membrane protein transport protein [Methylomicrobium sp. RS1]
MILKHVCRTTIALAILGGMPVVSEATNGYFAHGYGARSKALAGASTARPLDAFAAAINPASIAYLGDRLDAEIELFSPRRHYTVDGTPTLAPGAFPLNNGTVESDSEWFPVPAIGGNYRIDDQQAIGLTLYGNGGMNTDYVATPNPLCPFPGGSGTFCAGTTGIDKAQAFIVPSYAHTFWDGKLSLGIAPIFAIQRFKARGLSSFAPFSSDPEHLSNQGYDYSFGGGVRVGGLAELTPGLRFGASYKSRITMTELDDYAGLFANQGEFDIPESFNFGLAWDVTEQITTSFDVEHIRYSQIDSVGNPMLPNLLTKRLGDSGGPGFGWKDMTIFKFGTEWRPNTDWTLRAGLSYGEQPIPESEVLFNILAPGVQEWHLTTGFSRAIADKDEVSFAFMYSPSNSVKGPNPLSPSQNIELEMEQYSFQLAWSRHF